MEHKNAIQRPDLPPKDTDFEGLLPKAAEKIGEIGTELIVADVDKLNE
jgi:hypothetical protein